MKIRFEWDARKAASNFRKHGVTFEAASFVFSDEFSITRPDRNDKGEERWQTIGVSKNSLFLLVVHTSRIEIDGVEVIRIISARRLDRKERRNYENGYLLGR